jgi:hypothetical protein
MAESTGSVADMLLQALSGDQVPGGVGAGDLTLGGSGGTLHADGMLMGIATQDVEIESGTTVEGAGITLVADEGAGDVPGLGYMRLGDNVTIAIDSTATAGAIGTQSQHTGTIRLFSAVRDDASADANDGQFVWGNNVTIGGSVFTPNMPLYDNTPPEEEWNVAFGEPGGVVDTNGGSNNYTVFYKDFDPANPPPPEDPGDPQREDCVFDVSDNRCQGGPLGDAGTVEFAQAYGPDIPEAEQGSILRSTTGDIRRDFDELLAPQQQSMLTLP